MRYERCGKCNRMLPIMHLFPFKTKFKCTSCIYDGMNEEEKKLYDEIGCDSSKPSNHLESSSED